MKNIEVDQFEQVLKNFEIEELEERLEFVAWFCSDIVDPATGQVIGRKCGLSIPL